MALTIFVALMLVWTYASALLGRRVAEQKGRRPDEGYWLGMLFGLFGVLFEALLPAEQ